MLSYISVAMIIINSNVLLEILQNFVYYTHIQFYESVLQSINVKTTGCAVYAISVGI